MKKNVLCITRIDHLNGIYSLLNNVCNLQYYPKFSKLDIIKFLKSNIVDCIFCNPNNQNYILNDIILQHFSGQYICSASTGLNHIDTEYCKNNNIKIISHKNDMELLKMLPSTAELAFGLMLSLIRKIPSGFDSVKNFEWNYENFMGHQLQGLNIGIVGYGRLGQMMSHYCDAFGMNIFIYDPYYNLHCKYTKINTLEKLISNVDVLSLHVHVTNETRKFINKKTLVFANPELYIINTSRGEIINELDIIELLKSNKLGGYGTDVIDDEFGNITQSRLIKMAKYNKYNIVITPHVGGMTWEGQQLAYEYSIKKMEKILNEH